jgi:hypothetical protein
MHDGDLELRFAGSGALERIPICAGSSGTSAQGHAIIVAM